MAIEHSFVEPSPKAGLRAVQVTPFSGIRKLRDVSELIACGAGVGTASDCCHTCEYFWRVLPGAGWPVMFLVE